jgi:integrase
MVIAQLARFLELDDKRIKAIAGSYKPKPVDPAELPGDEEIIAIWETMGVWKWVYGMMATYGLRPHETFKVDLRKENSQLIATVKNDTKTGSRIVLPLHNSWTDLFSLETIVYPNIILDGRDNRRLSERISLRFREKRVPHSPKALRHAYSCRGARLGIGPDVMARLMGHSISVHCSTYQNAISLAQYQEILKKVDN